MMDINSEPSLIKGSLPLRLSSRCSSIAVMSRKPTKRFPCISWIHTSSSILVAGTRELQPSNFEFHLLSDFKFLSSSPFWVESHAFNQASSGVRCLNNRGRSARCNTSCFMQSLSISVPFPWSEILERSSAQKIYSNGQASHLIASLYRCLTFSHLIFASTFPT